MCTVTFPLRIKVDLAAVVVKVVSLTTWIVPPVPGVLLTTASPSFSDMS
jgi:hypothetical protein